MTDPADIAVAVIAALGILTAPGVVKVEKKIVHGVVHVVTLGKK